MSSLKETVLGQSLAEDDFLELEEVLFDDFELLNKQVASFLKRVRKGNIEDKVIHSKLKELEDTRHSLINKWKVAAREVGVEGIQNKIISKVRDRIHFRLRLFCALHKNILMEDEFIGTLYRTRYNRGMQNLRNINSVRDTQYLAWAILRDPEFVKKKDKDGEDTKEVTNDLVKFKALDDLVSRIYKGLQINGDKTVLTLIEGLKQGVLAHAATRSLLEESGYYVSAPPDPILDAEHATDLIAIKQGAFLNIVDSLPIDENSKKNLIEKVGSYGNGGKVDMWVEYLSEYPKLLEHVLWVQVKSHKSHTDWKKYGGSNIDIVNGDLDDSIIIFSSSIKNMSNEDYGAMMRADPRDPAFRQKTWLVTRGNNGKIHLGTSVREAAEDFRQIEAVLPRNGKMMRMFFVDMSHDDAIKLLKRRAGIE